MASVNKVFLMGNLTRDVELRYTKQGKPIAEMTVALNRRNGEREEVSYVDVAVWGKTAENCNRYIGKGSCVHVEGYLRQERWEDRQTGQARSKLRVIAEAIQFISTPKDNQSRATEANPANSGPVSTEYDPPPRKQPKENRGRFYGDPGVAAPPVDGDIPF